MKNIEIDYIRDEAKERYYYAIDSNSYNEIESTRQIGRDCQVKKEGE